jgi:hypothetical protein
MSSSDGALPRLRPRGGRRRLALVLFLILFALPIALSAGAYWVDRSVPNWMTADRSSAGLLPAPAEHREAIVRVFAARTVRWRGIFATHTWIVVKEAGAARYDRFDYTAWGEPIRTNGFTPDGRWFGRDPEVVFAADGETAAAAIPKIRAAIAAYAHRRIGDYRAWPGPNSNTFVAAVLASVPDLRASLPPTAIGKDYPYDGRWLGTAIGGLGVRLTLGGYLGFTAGWFEGLELNLLGAVLGIDIRRPAIKLPGIGRIGLAEALP